MVTEKSLMVYFGTVEDSLYKDAYLPFATAHPKIKFFTVSEPECAAEYSSKVPGIVFKNKNFEEGKYLSYEGESTTEAIDAWVTPKMVPSKFFEWHEDEFDSIFKKDQLTLVLFRDNKDKDEAFTKVFEDASKANEGKGALFSWNNGGKGSHEKGVKMLGANAA
jgi:hypothetical protein